MSKENTVNSAPGSAGSDGKALEAAAEGVNVAPLPLDSYAKSARRAIDVFIQDSTRHEPGEVSYRNEERCEVTVDVFVEHKLVCRISSETEMGPVDPSPDDMLAASDQEQSSNNAELCTQALAEYDVEGSLKAAVERASYGQYEDEKYLGSYRRRSLFNHECDRCSGKGRVQCTGCHGRGQNTCGSCGGMGSTTESRTSTDMHGHSTTHYETVSCSWCMGSGRRTCTSCGGSGDQRCGTCGGHGTVTEISTPGYFLISSYSCKKVDPKDPEIDFALFKRTPRLSMLAGDVGVLRSRKVVANPLLRRLNESVEIEVSFYRAKASVNGHESNVTVYGCGLLMSDMGGVIEKLVESDLQLLQDAVTKIRSFDPLSVRYALKCAEVFLASEVHQEAIKKCSGGVISSSSYERLSDDIARALPPEYLEKAIGSLFELYQLAYADYQRIGWLLATPILLVCTAWGISLEYPAVTIACGAMGAVLVYWIIRGFTNTRFEKIANGILMPMLRNSVLV